MVWRGSQTRNIISSCFSSSSSSSSFASSRLLAAMEYCKQRWEVVHQCEKKNSHHIRTASSTSPSLQSLFSSTSSSSLNSQEHFDLPAALIECERASTLPNTNMPKHEFNAKAESQKIIKLLDSLSEQELLFFRSLSPTLLIEMEHQEKKAYKEEEDDEEPIDKKVNECICTCAYVLELFRF